MRDCSILINAMDSKHRSGSKEILKQREYDIMEKLESPPEHFRREPFHLTYMKRMKERENNDNSGSLPSNN